MGFPFGQYVHLDVPTEDANITDIDVYNICEFLEYVGYYSNSTELVKYIMNKSKQ